MLHAFGLIQVELIDFSPLAQFHSHVYLRHNHRCLEHLASLGLPIVGASVLEVGAGVGDHTSFFIDRGCTVLSTEARPENLAILQSRYRNLGLESRELDLDNPVALDRSFDIVYCYGVLYHLRRPAEAIAFMAGHCCRMLLLETCVSVGDHQAVNPIAELAENPTQALDGHGCRPTRPWIYARLKEHFEHVYLPRTQPHHGNFPIDWTAPPPSQRDAMTRAIFIASRQPLDNPLLTEELLAKQVRQN